MFIKNKPKLKKPFKFIRSDKQVSLIRYWTTRYLFTLCIGLIVVAIISALWIRHNTFENRLNLMSVLAEGMADRIVAMNDNEQPPPNFLNDRQLKTELDINPLSYIVDANGNIISRNRINIPLEEKLTQSILNDEENIQKLTFYKETFYLVKASIEVDDTVVGWVVMLESKENLTYVKQEYTQLAIMLISLALLGWAAIYVLSKRLAKPIKSVSEAAKFVAEGNYYIDIPNDNKEKEVYELVHSFKEMTKKLEKLESLRTELLAGVTHELKTPVTSISGLLQALKDGVVTGDEAKEFLNISLNETEKMKTMVEDLLAFNQFATNTIQVNHEVHNINEVVENAVFSWQVAQKEELEVKIQKLSHTVEVTVDPLRFQQVMTNLLNNAKDALAESGEISVSLIEEETLVYIDVADTGSGIPEEEQPFIFERFYRGEKKKYKTRGLGLGLALSKMIIQTLGGDLILLKSSTEGTTFRIILSKNNR